MEHTTKKKIFANGAAAFFLALILTSVCFYFGVFPSIMPISPELKTFSNYEELHYFLKMNMERAKNFNEFFITPIQERGEISIFGSFDEATAGGDGSDYSSTNIQVAGVDEADIIKSDGEFLYLVSNNSIYILKAYPPEEAELLSEIVLDETYEIEIFVNEDDLVVLQKNCYYCILEAESSLNFWDSFIKIYDISDKTNPVLSRNIVLQGTLSSSRMIGDYVYALVYHPAIQQNYGESEFEVVLPRICSDSTVKEVQPTEITYVEIADSFYYFTTIVAINIKDNNQTITYESFLTGSASSIYVSLSNFYLTVPNTNVWLFQGLENVPEETLIYRVSLHEENIVLDAEGSVFGRVLNQFSMDEYNGYFRIATTEWMNGNFNNNLFILNMTLDIVGKINNIATGERIYSTRFIGDKCYLVTFKQIDPFFVIDLSDPKKPEILGELKIPGFSSYLHPYDDNHIIGIGKQDSNIKFSFFNVTDANEPIEIVSPYIVEGEWSESTVLYDHKAFLFSRSKQLLVVPISINWLETENNGNNLTINFWQGVYVFNITVDEGFVLKGRISHFNETSNNYDSDCYIKRTLYIENVLYTISNRKIAMNLIDDLSLIKELVLF